MIQVKRVSANSLIHPNDISDTMHAFEKTLDVFKLPLATNIGC